MGLFRRRREDDAARLDERSLRQLAKQGADLTKPRRVVHRLAFPHRDAATAAAETIRADGWRVHLDASAFGSSWIVRAEAERVVSRASCARDREWFGSVARAGDGDYDGWEASATP
ncbi:MAG TPA: ribonuclease E inhibitor RraB [Actinomycetota bacterium]|jgi:hypothetical protein